MSLRPRSTKTNLSDQIGSLYHNPVGYNATLGVHKAFLSGNDRRATRNIGVKLLPSTGGPKIMITIKYGKFADMLELAKFERDVGQDSGIFISVKGLATAVDRTAALETVQMSMSYSAPKLQKDFNSCLPELSFAFRIYTMNNPKGTMNDFANTILNGSGSFRTFDNEDDLYTYEINGDTIVLTPVNSSMDT
jgi:hypothetical protein